MIKNVLIIQQAEIIENNNIWYIMMQGCSI